MDLAMNTFSIMYGLFGIVMICYCSEKYNGPTNIELAARGDPGTNSTGPK